VGTLLDIRLRYNRPSPGEVPVKSGDAECYRKDLSCEVVGDNRACHRAGMDLINDLSTSLRPVAAEGFARWIVKGGMKATNALTSFVCVHFISGNLHQHRFRIRQQRLDNVALPRLYLVIILRHMKLCFVKSITDAPTDSDFKAIIHAIWRRSCSVAAMSITPAR
ncbi:hypothetical protein ACJMK2_019460, partial [Sinanodonta woodiana]